MTSGSPTADTASPIMLGVKREYFSDDDEDGDESPEDSDESPDTNERKPAARAVKKSKASPTVSTRSTSTGEVKPKRGSKSTSKSATDSGKSRAPGKGKKWTGPELEALLHAALGGSVPTTRFTDKIPGRSVSQCEQTWRWVTVDSGMSLL